MQGGDQIPSQPSPSGALMVSLSSGLDVQNEDFYFGGMWVGPSAPSPPPECSIGIIKSFLGNKSYFTPPNTLSCVQTQSFHQYFR